MESLQTSWVLDNFLEFERALNGSAKTPLHQVRRQAFDSFKARGFPGPKVEDWKYTDLSAVRSGSFVRNKAVRILDTSFLKTEFLNLTDTKLVFVNGFFNQELSGTGQLPKGVVFGNFKDLNKDATIEKLIAKYLGQTLEPETDALVSLNTAFTEQGTFVFVPAGVELVAPISILHIIVAEQQAVFSPGRTLVVLQAGAKAQVIESFVGKPGKNFSCHVSELILEDSASLTHTKIVAEGENAHHYGRISANVGRSASLSTHTFSYAGATVRNEVCPNLIGQGCSCSMNGLTVLTGTEHVDNHTVLDHAMPHCESRELYKGIYAAKSNGAFCGTIIVRPDAQKTNALQTNQSLLLSKDASVDSKPQLKIWADDVKCTHGATVGQLDEQALFYVRSRGVPFEIARNMLVQAFAGDLISAISYQPLRELLEQLLHDKLALIGVVDN